MSPAPSPCVVAAVPGGRSGAGLRQGVVGPEDRLCVGDSGRLSLEDSEWWRPEEKLRLVCRTVDCLEIFLKRDFLLGREENAWEDLSQTGRDTAWSHQCRQTHVGRNQTLWYCRTKAATLPGCIPAPGHPGHACHFIPLCFCPPVLAVPFPALLAPSGHPCFGAVFPGRANFNGGVLQGGGPQGDLIATLRTEKGSLSMLHSSTSV